MMALRRIVVVVLSMGVCLHVQTAAQNVSGRPKPFAESHTTLKSADHQFLPYDLPVYKVEGSENENFRYYAPALRLVVIKGSGDDDATVKRNYLSRSGSSCAIEDDCVINRVQLFLQRVNQGPIIGAIRGQNTEIEADPLLAEYQLESGEMYDGLRFQSVPLSVGTWSSDGPVPVSFTLGARENAVFSASSGRNEASTVAREDFVDRATNFIDNLERGNDVLKLRYAFSGVSTDICLATYTFEAKSKISVHEDRQTAEYVTLKRVSDIAESASESQHVELTCGRDPARTAMLRDFIKDHLARNAAEGGTWVTWEDAADMLSPQDQNDFATNVIREEGYTKQDIDQGRADRDGSWAVGGDVRGCYGPICLGAGVAIVQNDTTSEQTYSERGVAYTFTGERYEPQWIAVYRSDAVQRAVNTLATFDLGSKEAERGIGDVTLSFAQAWVRQSAINPLYSSYESVHAEVERVRDDLKQVRDGVDGLKELVRAEAEQHKDDLESLLYRNSRLERDLWMVAGARTTIKPCPVNLRGVRNRFVDLRHSDWAVAWLQRDAGDDETEIYRDRRGNWVLRLGSRRNDVMVYFANGAEVTRMTTRWRDTGGDLARRPCQG